MAKTTNKQMLITKGPMKSQLIPLVSQVVCSGCSSQNLVLTMEYFYNYSSSSVLAVSLRTTLFRQSCKC